MDGPILVLAKSPSLNADREPLICNIQITVYILKIYTYITIYITRFLIIGIKMTKFYGFKVLKLLDMTK